MSHVSSRPARAPRHRRLGLAVATLLATTLAVGVTPSIARAADADRDDRVELFVLGQFSLADEITQEGIEVEYEDTFGAGVGLGVNATERVNLNLTVLFGEATLAVDDFGLEESSPFINPELNFDVNFLDQDVTPFVTGGVGMIFLTDLGEESEEALTLGGGGGVRWDFADQAFLKVWYRLKWFELDGAEEGFFLHTFNVGIGWMR